MMMTVFFGVLLSTVFVSCYAIDISQQTFPDFIGLMSRDAETLPGPLAFGHKYMTGGAGEGSQQLRPESDFEQREQISIQVKSDNVLPAYCEPPNPCPLGYTVADGCIEEFENSAEFSRNYQSSQTCICDQEHMFNCPAKGADELEESIQNLLDEHGFHKNLIAKKFHQKREDFMEPRRKRRSIPVRHNARVNPYLQGEPLKTVSKKDGRNTW
uniref:Neuroendocrine protein 7B2 n=1 Tax=Ascaris suum TaxID=6253 RepID=F1LC15_ASCSU